MTPKRTCDRDSGRTKDGLYSAMRLAPRWRTMRLASLGHTKLSAAKRRSTQSYFGYSGWCHHCTEVRRVVVCHQVAAGLLRPPEAFAAMAPWGERRGSQASVHRGAGAGAVCNVPRGPQAARDNSPEDGNKYGYKAIKRCRDAVAKTRVRIVDSVGMDMGNTRTYRDTT
ncbi:hypothetical protein C8Q72DRAFT_452218 [Fomitopsis betulina]|nr:hypothetical protein C8Q72DRAFT_452218 [Fomitopsis betulina]